MRFLVFDVESVGLHGEGFAVGLVIIDSDGTSIPYCFACPPEEAKGDADGRAWIEAHVNVAPSPYACRTPRDVRANFWEVWSRFREKDGYLAADVPWPVEARFLLDCIADDPEGRAWHGPYPLIDIASVRLAAGFNPLGIYDRLPDELPEHDPLCDSRQSARLLLEALELLKVAL